MLHMMAISQGCSTQTITVPDYNIVLTAVHMGRFEGHFDQGFYTNREELKSNTSIWNIALW